MFIDTHSHIYLEQFAIDKNEMLERASAAGITTILMPAIDSGTHEEMMKLEEIESPSCRSMIGLHPCSVNGKFKDQLSIIDNYLKTRKFVAIGETGLDFYWDLSFRNEQYQALEQQIEWALQYELPLVIHSRDATDACIEVVKKYADRNLTGVFHCFGGTIDQAQTIIDNNFYLGIGGVLTFKKSGLDAVLDQLPLDNIILETDAPYLAPVPYRGKRNEPAYIPFIAEKLAEIKQASVEDVARITTENAKKLFKLDV